MARNRIGQRHYRRRHDRRKAHDRILVVCEGSKTEPLYFHEIRMEQNLSKKLVRIIGCPGGTEPSRIVESAQRIFVNGDADNDIDVKAFDRIFAVFDRDKHPSYRNALAKAAGLDQKLKNDEGITVPFEAIPSSPCFELWLLLHYVDVTAYASCDDLENQLRRHNADYKKSNEDNYASTKCNLAEARTRAMRLVASSSPISDTEPYTTAHLLVDTLLKLKK